MELLTVATITTQAVGDPCRPLRRFVSLLQDSGTLRGFDTTSIAPMYAHEIRASIFDGMQTEIVYLPTVVDQILSDHSEEIDDAIGSG